MRARQPGPVAARRRGETDPGEDDRPGGDDRERASARDRGPREGGHRGAEERCRGHDIEEKERRVGADRDHGRYRQGGDRQPQVEAIDPPAAVREKDGRRHRRGDQQRNVDSELGSDQECLGDGADDEGRRERARGDGAVHPMPPKT
jgi:hypothetical protein